jgi:acyl-CoA synthetase (AMP-forming)/AMP-acid ligase II
MSISCFKLIFTNLSRIAYSLNENLTLSFILEIAYTSYMISAYAKNIYAIFQGNLGGARIGIVAKPSAEFVAGVLATWFSGGVAVPLALSYPEVELLYVMNNSVCFGNSLILKIQDDITFNFAFWIES